MLNRSEKNRCYYEANKEKILFKQKERRKRRKEYYLEYNKKYYQNNKEKAKEYARKYQVENKEKIYEKQKQRYKNNPEYLKQYRATKKYKDMIRKYNANNKEKLKAYQKKRRDNNPEKYKAIMTAAHKKYMEKNKSDPNFLRKIRDMQNKFARESNKTLEGNFVLRCKYRYKTAKKKFGIPNKCDIRKETFWELFDKQQGLCPLTGISLILVDPNTGEGYVMYEVDHIIPVSHPNSFHGKDNIQLVFPYSNGVKSNSI